MRIEDAEDHAIPAVEELSVPVDPVVASNSSMKMVLQIVSKIICAYTVCQPINFKLSILYP